MVGRVVLLATGLLLATIPEPAGAFTRSLVPGTGVCLFWKQRQIPWAMHERGASHLGPDESLRALRGSFRTWEEVDCSDLRFRELPPTAAVGVGYDASGPNTNLLVFRERSCVDAVDPDDSCWESGSCANLHNCWAFSMGVIAVTTTSFRQDTGEILDADVEFNAAGFLFTTVDGPPCRGGVEGIHCVATDLANTATHEIGHMFGLDHSPWPEATMYASAPAGETSKRTLAADDREALCTIYPAGKPVDVCEEAYGLRRDGAGGGCTAGGGAPVGWGLLVGLVGMHVGCRRR